MILCYHFSLCKYLHQPEVFAKKLKFFKFWGNEKNAMKKMKLKDILIHTNCKLIGKDTSEDRNEEIEITK